MSTAGRERPCRWQNDSLIVTARVRPNAPRNELSAHGAELQLWVQCPPLDGGANREAMAVLAGLFRVPKQSVELRAGQRCRIKRFRIYRPRLLPEVIQAMLAAGK